MIKQIENLELPDDVLSFLDTVASNTKGYNVYLGGGYLRDKYYNELTLRSHKEVYGDNSDFNHCVGILEPKDLDLFFVCDGTSDKQLPTIEKSYINYDKSSEDIPDMQERGVERVRGLFVPALSTSDVQFIVYHKEMSIGELVEDMDCNINQVMYDPVNKTTNVSDNFIDGHDNEYIEMLHYFDYIRMAKRVHRMSLKFPDYSIYGKWDFTELVDRVADHSGSFCGEE